jgi:hypothetical protein
MGTAQQTLQNGKLRVHDRNGIPSILTNGARLGILRSCKIRTYEVCDAPPFSHWRLQQPLVPTLPSWRSANPNTPLIRQFRNRALLVLRTQLKPAGSFMPYPVIHV